MQSNHADHFVEGNKGIDERTRGRTQRWFDMVDWTHVGSVRLGISRSIEAYAQKLEGEVYIKPLEARKGKKHQ